MAYAKLKQGKTYRTKGYEFKEGIWINVEEKDVQYFVDSKRIEFAPAGIVPKNDEIKGTDGVIAMQGNGKDAIVGTKVNDNISTELDQEEEDAILRIRNKYRVKREKKIAEKVEKDRLKKEKKEKEKKENELKGKGKGVQDVTDKQYIRDKDKAKR